MLERPYRQQCSERRIRYSSWVYLYYYYGFSFVQTTLSTIVVRKFFFRGGKFLIAPKTKTAVGERVVIKMQLLLNGFEKGEQHSRQVPDAPF